MRTAKWVAWSVLGSLMVSGILAGCNPAAGGRMQTQSIEPRYDNRGIDLDGDGDRAWLSGNNNMNNPPVNLRSLAPMGGGSADLTQSPYSGWVTADRVADLVQTVPGVANASAVLRGQTAVVGLTLHRSVPRERAAQIAQEVRRMLLVQAPVFRSVHISTDNVLSRRVFDVSQNIRNGRPLSSMDGEIERLTRDIPVIPPR